MVKIVFRKTGFCLSACETSETELCKVDLLSEKKVETVFTKEQNSTFSKEHFFQICLSN